MPNDFTYPRPEYPRPDRQRGTHEGIDWLNLNGPWQFRFDADRRGEHEGWHQPADTEWREQIIVPFCWESLAAWGEGEAAGNENYYSTRVYLHPLEVTNANHRSAPRHEVGWYRRIVHVPENARWQDKRVILTIGAADFITDCWCNGQHLGRHEGGYTPFEFDLTDALTSSVDGRTAQIVLRVEDPMDNHEQPVGKQWRWYTTVSGIWQTVFLEPRNASHIEKFRIITDIDAGTAQFVVKCVDAEGLVVSAQITPPKGDPQSATFAVKNGEGRESVIISPVLLWNPNEPHLYKTVLELQRGKEVVDRIQTYFGMRKIDFAPSEEARGAVALRLNNHARYLRGALHQSYYPEGIYTAGSVNTLKKDIAFAKQVGFNFLRIHIKIDDPLLLYWADRLGMLIMADFPNFGEGGDTPVGRRRFESMMRAAIDRDFNHPSIFAWCMFNETWGFGGQSELVNLIHPINPKERGRSRIPGAVSASRNGGNGIPVLAGAGVSAVSAGVGAAISAGVSASATAVVAREPKAKLANLSSHAWVQSMWELAKKLDPTRLIEDMSVCHWDHLDYFAHGDTDINSWHFYIDNYDRAKEHIRKIVDATYVGSEFNYVPGYKHKGQPLINSEYGGVGALDGDRDVSWSFKFLTNELRRYGQISAYIFTELHDVEWEHNGFLNYDRTPKDFGYDPSIVNESDTLPIDAPPISSHPLGARIQVPVSSSHYSTRSHKNVTLHWRVGGIDTAGRLHQELGRGSVPIPFPHQRVAPAHTIELMLPDQPMLCSLMAEACRADGTIVAKNFTHFLAWNGYPPARQETERSLILRAYPTDWAAAEWSAGMGNRDEDRASDWCYGMGHGYFEWLLPLGNADLTKAYRLKVLCEASSHRTDTPQTDDDIFPTTIEMYLNSVPIYEATLRNHPHDSRGVLSYLRGGRGAYGYLAHAYVEGDLLQRVIQASNGTHLRLRIAVPETAVAHGGLTVYGAECGRYPVCPTIIIDW
jgi:hypothetical protein